MSQDERFDDLVERIQQMQVKARERVQKRNPSSPLKRGFHAKGTGVRGKFQVRSELPSHLQVGLFQPGAPYDALVRFSNARGEVLGDLSKDQRGVAIRVKTNLGESLSPEQIWSMPYLRQVSNRFQKGCLYQKSKGWMSRLMSIPEPAGNWPG